MDYLDSADYSKISHNGHRVIHRTIHSALLLAFLSCRRPFLIKYQKSRECIRKNCDIFGLWKINLKKFIFTFQLVIPWF